MKTQQPCVNKAAIGYPVQVHADAEYKVVKWETFGTHIHVESECFYLPIPSIQTDIST